MKSKILVITGQQASGKTTLLRAISETLADYQRLHPVEITEDVLHFATKYSKVKALIIDEVTEQSQVYTLQAWHGRYASINLPVFIAAQPGLDFSAPCFNVVNLAKP